MILTKERVYTSTYMRATDEYEMNESLHPALMTSHRQDGRQSGRGRVWMRPHANEISFSRC